jgi:mannose-6-phosphate isomerase-like protein (cupin superfamily)
VKVCCPTLSKELALLRTGVLVLVVLLVGSAARSDAQAPPQHATDVTRAEFMTVLKSMNPDGVSDQQLKVVDLGAYNVAVGILHRSGKAKQTAIAHSLVTEIYYVVAGSGTFVTGGVMNEPAAAAADGTVVKVLVGPSTTGATIRDGQSRRIGPGDVIIVPPGVAHWFSAIEEDLDYLVFRVDSEKVLPAGYVHPLLKK